MASSLQNGTLEAQLTQIPDDVMHTIIRYVYGSAKSIGRFSLVSKRWITSVYSALDYVNIDHDTNPLHLLASASPSHVCVGSYIPDHLLSSEGHNIISQLLLTAKSVSLRGDIGWNKGAYAGCLKNVEELSVTAESLVFLEKMIFGSSNGSAVAQSHPLRVLEFQGQLISFVVNLFNSERFPHLATITCTDKSFPAMRSHTSLQHLTWVQHETRCLSTEFTVFEEDDALNDVATYQASTAFMRKMKEEIPPHLAADLSQVCFTDLNGLTTPMNAIPFLLAQSVAQVESTLGDYPLTDGQATLFALGANHLKELFDSDTFVTNDVSVTAEDLNLQQYKIQALLDRGADLFAPVVCLGEAASRVSTTVFHIAVSRGSPATVSALYNFVTAEQVNRIRDQYGLTPLHYAPLRNESWIECFNWHNTKVPSWKVSDADNVYNDSPIARMLKNCDSHSKNLILLLAHVVVQQKDCFSDLSFDSLLFLVSSLAQRWKETDKESDEYENDDNSDLVVAWATEETLQGRSAQELGADSDAGLLAFLLVALPDIFKKIIKELPATHLVDALTICMRIDRSNIDLFFDALKSNGMEHIPLITSQGDTIIERCQSEQDGPSYAKLVLDHSVDPVLSTYSSNREMISAFGRPGNEAKEEEEEEQQQERDKEVDLERGVALASLYLEKNRPDLALLVFSEMMIGFCENSGCFQVSLPPLRKFEPLCSLLFGNEQFLKFLQDPAATIDDQETALDLLEAALSVLLSPFDLAPLSEDLYATLLPQLVTRLVAAHSVTKDLSDDVIDIYSLKPTLAAAILTFYMGDKKRQQAVMSVLPQLVGMGKKAFYHDKMTFYELGHCMDCISAVNPNAHALLVRVFDYGDIMSKSAF